MKKITTNISNKQYKAFHKIAQKEGLTFSELIRRALDEYLERRLKNVSHDTNKPTN